MLPASLTTGYQGRLLALLLLLVVLGGDPRSTVGAGSEAAKLGGSAYGTETTSAWTVMGATNPKTRARARIGTTILCMWVLSSAPHDSSPGRRSPPDA